MWNKLRTEYKLLIVIGCIFLVILIIYMLKSDVVGKVKLQNKIEENKNCTSYNRGHYVDYTCNIKDEKGTSFTLNYPQLSFNSNNAKTVNASIKKLYEDSLKDMYYYIDNNGKLVLTDYILIKYDIYERDNILSLVIYYNTISSGEEFYNRKFLVYNFSLDSGTLINDTDLKDMLKIDRQFAADLKSEIIKMYSYEFAYDYYGELEGFRNNPIDYSIENFNYSNINKVYLKNDGSINILLNLFDPNYGFEKYYLFTYLNNKFTYQFIDTKAPTNGALVN